MVYFPLGMDGICPDQAEQVGGRQTFPGAGSRNFPQLKTKQFYLSKNPPHNLKGRLFKKYEQCSGIIDIPLKKKLELKFLSSSKI